MTTRTLLGLLKSDGWKLERVNGSHHVFRHPTKIGIVVVPVHTLGADVPLGTLNSIIKKASLK